MSNPVAVADPAAFAGAYPVIATGLGLPSNTTQFNNLWSIATGYVSNTPQSTVTDQGAAQTILFLIVCHLAIMTGAVSGNGTVGAGVASGTGRVESATQGSVSVKYNLPEIKTNASALQQWLAQTQYGQMAWALLQPWLIAPYVPGPGAYTYTSPTRIFGAGIP